MFDANFEINKITKLRSVQVFLFREMRKAKFCQKFVKFREVSPKFAPRETTKISNYKVMSL